MVTDGARPRSVGEWVGGMKGMMGLKQFNQSRCLDGRGRKKSNHCVGSAVLEC